MGKRKRSNADPTLAANASAIPQPTAPAPVAPKRKPRKPTKNPGQRARLEKNSFDLGQNVGKSVDTSKAIPAFDATEGVSTGALGHLMEKGKIKADAQFKKSFRAVGPGMDEFFSTSTMRKFLQGLLGNWSALSAAEQQYLGGLVDLLSAIRAPTPYVGYSFSGSYLQHPTADGAGIFGRWQDTMSDHSQIDTERREYVQRAAQAAIDSNQDALGIVVAAARAAIEFTLNNFMAPITASNVQPYSTMSNLPLTDPSLLKQPKWREQLKSFYVDVLGGTLDQADPNENAATSITRSWNPPWKPGQAPVGFTPLSPPRETDEEKIAQAQKKAASSATGVARADALQQSGLTIFAQTPSNSNDLSVYNNPNPSAPPLEPSDLAALADLTPSAPPLDPSDLAAFRQGPTDSADSVYDPAPSAPPLEEEREESGLTIFGQSPASSNIVSIDEFEIDPYGSQLASSTPAPMQVSNDNFMRNEIESPLNPQADAYRLHDMEVDSLMTTAPSIPSVASSAPTEAIATEIPA